LNLLESANVKTFDEYYLNHTKEFV
jgi:hypothetical protein